MRDREPEEQEIEEAETHPVVVIENPDDLNRQDDDAIIAMMTGQAIEEYVYSFRQGGKVVQGLTLAGINEAANRRGGIQVEEVRFEERENSWIAVVKATDTYTGNSRYGAYEQAKKSGGRDDPFAFTKAIHKAQRNAIKQLLPAPILKEIIRFYLGARGAGPAGVETARKERATQAEKEDRITSQQKAAFSLAQRLREALERQGISQDDFWNFVRRRFNVRSRNDMREDHWATLAAELHAASESKELFHELAEKVKHALHAQGQEAEPVEDADEADEPETEEGANGTREETEAGGKAPATPRPARSRRGSRSSQDDSLF